MKKINYKHDYKIFINGTKNDFKIMIDDLFNIIETIKEDVEKLKAENL